MSFQTLPTEIVSSILKLAAITHAEEGVNFTYGLTQAPLPLQKPALTRYVRGPANPDALRWDATATIRSVCRKWHAWALQYSMESVIIRKWRGSERWAELSTKRKLYDIYELIEKPSGFAVYRDPYNSLRETQKLFSQYPAITNNVRRLWFNGFLTRDTDRLIFQVLRSCRFLTSISVPWTLLRHGSVQDWVHLLGTADEDDLPVQSLELQAVCLKEATTSNPAFDVDFDALKDPRVDFGQLRRLKLIGNTTWKPVDDEDLAVIARSATGLKEFHITSLSTISIKGVVSIIKASKQTLRVIEHSPRSDDGFFHPDPGCLDTDEHICEILVDCPRLKDLSISVPSMCSHLFSHEDVRWEGECQVRATTLCDCTKLPRTQQTRQTKVNSLRKTLNQARDLIVARQRQRKDLEIELFFADCIFDPRD